MNNRRVFMICLIVAFLLLAPAIVLYTAGYRYNWRFHRIDQTGVLSIDARPSDAAVFINGVQIQKNLPLRLPNRNPGTYTVELKKNGFHTWRKDITIESKKTTYIKNVDLLRESLPVPIVDDKPISSFSPSTDGSFILFTEENDQVATIYLLNTANNETTMVARMSVTSKPLIYWSPYIPVAAIETYDKEIVYLQLFNPTSGALSNRYPFLKNSLSSLRHWQSDSIFVSDNGTIRRLLIGSIETMMAVSPTTTWYIAEDLSLWRVDLEKNAIIHESENKNISYPKEQNIQSVVHIDESKAILQTATGLRIYTRGRSIDEGRDIRTTEILYQKETGEWLAWSPWELWSIDRDGATGLLHRSSEATASVSPLDNHGLALLATAHTLHAFNPGYSISTELFRGGDIEAATANMTERRIYFLGAIGKTKGIFFLNY